MAKIVVLAEGWPIYTPPTPTFRDVPADHVFYTFIETAYNHGIISGYACGTGCLEYRPGNNVTRAQLSKIIVLVAGWQLLSPPPPPHFNDVPPGSVYYDFIEEAYCHQVFSGYNCGGPGEPCPGLYFRPGNNATRAQIARMVCRAVRYLPCAYPTPTPTR